MPTQKRSFGARVNSWLQEAPHEQFKDNKWKFWFVTLCGFQLLNAVLTAAVFNAGGQLQNAMGAIVLAVGALLAYLGVAFLHYSDSTDRQLATRVSVLDSITLVCVLAHFTFLLWTFGHLRTLQNAEAKYEAAAATYNAKAEKVSDDNVRIAASAERIATETTKAERLRNDAAYQLRKAAEAGARGVPRPGSTAPGVTAPALATSTVELEKPQKPEESSAAFLSRWDAAIRLANLAELILAAATLIYIRVRSAKTNAPHLPLFGRYPSVVNRTPAPVGNFTKKKEPTKNHGSFDIEGLRKLREALKDISFRLAGYSFKSAIRGDAVFIYLMKANAGTQEATHTAKCKLDILRDARTMPRDKFTERLTRLLKQNKFPIE